MAKTFDLELRIEKSGTVLSWVVFLENPSPAFKVTGWLYNMEKGFYYIKFKQYKIDDDVLDVFVGGEGKIGASVTCAVLIDNKPQEKAVVFKCGSSKYAHGKY